MFLPSVVCTAEVCYPYQSWLFCTFLCVWWWCCGWFLVTSSILLVAVCLHWSWSLPGSHQEAGQWSWGWVIWPGWWPKVIEIPDSTVKLVIFPFIQWVFYVLFTQVSRLIFLRKWSFSVHHIVKLFSPSSWVCKHISVKSFYPTSLGTAQRPTSRVWEIIPETRRWLLLVLLTIWGVVCIHIVFQGRSNPFHCYQSRLLEPVQYNIKTFRDSCPKEKAHSLPHESPPPMSSTKAMLKLLLNTSIVHSRVSTTWLVGNITATTAS